MPFNPEPKRRKQRKETGADKQREMNQKKTEHSFSRFELEEADHLLKTHIVSIQGKQLNEGHKHTLEEGQMTYDELVIHQLAQTIMAITGTLEFYHLILEEGDVNKLITAIQDWLGDITIVNQEQLRRNKLDSASLETLRKELLSKGRRQ